MSNAVVGVQSLLITFVQTTTSSLAKCRHVLQRLLATNKIFACQLLVDSYVPYARLSFTFYYVHYLAHHNGRFEKKTRTAERCAHQSHSHQRVDTK